MSSADMSSDPPQKTCRMTCREDMKTCREDIDDMSPICRLEIRRHVFMETTCRDMSSGLGLVNLDKATCNFIYLIKVRP